MTGRVYAVTMFVHVLGVIALFGAFVLQHRLIARLRQVARYEEARPWADLLVALRSMMPSGVVMLLASGAYLAGRLSPRPPSWVAVAAAAVLFIGVVALAVVNPYITAAHRAVAQGDGPLSGAAARAIASPRVPAALAAANGAALGTLWLMTARPGTLEATLVVVVATALGALIGARVARGAARSPGVHPRQAD
jgi:hypothetical protein